MLWVNSMSQYKIEKRIKYATDGTIISTVWDIYYEDGKIARRGLDTEEMAQEIMEYLEMTDKLEAKQHHRNEPN